MSNGLKPSANARAACVTSVPGGGNGSIASGKRRHTDTTYRPAERLGMTGSAPRQRSQGSGTLEQPAATLGAWRGIAKRHGGATPR